MGKKYLVIIRTRLTFYFVIKYILYISELCYALAHQLGENTPNAELN
jgi:hypothetical protein